MAKYWVLCTGCRCVSVLATQGRCDECGPRKHTHGGSDGSRVTHYGVEREPVQRRKVYERDNWRCGICRRRINQQLKHPDPMSASLDHIVPMSLGGNHTYVNVQAAHLICNLRKSHNGTGDQLALIG